jgi:mono/diheme cytochrome c family protein
MMKPMPLLGVALALCSSPALAAGPSPGGGPPPAAPPSPESSRPVDLADGASLYMQVCNACHGPEAKGGQGGGPNLLSFQASYIATTATTGKGTAMPSFRGVFTADQLSDIAGYVTTTLATNK